MVTFTDIGPPVGNRASATTTATTYLALDNPANNNGVVTHVEIMAVTALTGLKVGVFYLVSGTTYHCRSAITLGDVATVGAKVTFELATPLTVVAGDVIGFYVSAGTMEYGVVADSGWTGTTLLAGDHVILDDESVYAAITAESAISIFGRASIVPDLTDISLCEFDDWDGGFGGVDAVDQIQGVQCLSNTYTSAGLKTIQYESISQVDLTGKIIYAWIWVAKQMLPDTKANGGVRICAQDSSARNAEWYVGGRDTIGGGWTGYAVGVDATPNYADAGFDKTAIVKVGWRVNLKIKGIVKWDAFRYGKGLKIERGTSGNKVTFDSITEADENDNNKYGVAKKVEGVYFIAGDLVFGHATLDTYFTDTSKIVVFMDKIVPVTQYELKIIGGSGTTEIFFGTKSGTRGISGCIFKSAGTARYKITASDTNITKFGFYGCTLLNAATITLQTYSVNKEVLNCNFEGCYKIIANTCKIQYSNFIAPSGETPAVAVQMSSTSHNITNCAFINCSRAIEITVAGPFSFNDLDFSGNTYDVLNNAGVSVTVNYDQYCSPAPSTYDPAGSSVTFQTSVTLTIRHVKSLNPETIFVQCAIYRKSDMYQIMNKEATIADDQNPTYYKASESWTQTGIVVIVKAREVGYLPFEIELTIPAGGLDVTAVWIPDPNYTP